MENEVRDPYEYEVDLRDYIMVIWRKKWTIALIFVIAVGAALGFSLSTTPEYSTQASLIVTSPVASQLVDTSGGVQGVDYFSSEFDYRELGLSDDLLGTIRSDLKLTSESESGRSLNWLKNRMSINLTSPEDSKKNSDQRVLTLTVTGSNRGEIKEIANKWAELYVKRASEVLSNEISRYRELLSTQYSDLKEKLKEKIEERIDAREKFNLGFLKIETDVLKSKYKDYLSSLESKKLELEKQRAKLTELNSALQNEPRYFYLERSIPYEEIYNQSSEGSSEGDRSGSDKEGPPTVEVRDQKINEVFQNFQMKKIEFDIEASSLKKEVEFLESKISEFTRKINENQARIDRTQSDLDELDREINRLRKESDSLYSTLEEVRTTIEESDKSIQLFSGADSVKTIGAVNTKQNVAVAGVLGLFIGVLVAFFRNYMEGYEEEEAEESESD